MIVQTTTIIAELCPKPEQKPAPRKRTADVIFEFGYCVNDSAHHRHKALDKAVAELGYVFIIRSLAYQAAVSSSRSSHESKTYSKDQEWVYNKYHLSKQHAKK